MEKILNKNKTQTAIIVLLTIIFTILFFQMFGKAYREGGYDFTSYLLSSKALLNNTNPYIQNTPYPYIYPLFLAALLTPFTFLPYSVNNILWFFINIGSFGFSVYFLLKIFYKIPISKKVLLTTIFFIVALIFSPIQNHLLNGQANFLVLLFSTLFFYLYDKNNIFSCLFLAYAISLKIVPLIFLIFLLIEKKYRSIILTIVFIFVCVFVLPYFFAGVKIVDYYSYYLDNFIFNSFSSVKTVDTSKPMYFTLYGFITNIFPSSRSFGTYLQIVSASSLLLPILYLHYQLLKINVFQRKLLLFSLLSLSILLINPSSQTHHLVFITPSIFLIIINIYKKIDTEKRLLIFYYTLAFILFWSGNIFKYTPLVFLSLSTLFIIIILPPNKIRLSNEKIR